MAEDLHQVFDFVVAEDGDLMLLIYKIEDEPTSPAFELDKEKKTLWLHRGSNSVELQDINEDILNKLLKMQKLLVCEMNMPTDMENSEPEYIYEAVKL